MGYSTFHHPETFRSSRSLATFALDPMSDCHPLATTVCVKPGSPYVMPRVSRIRRKDKSRSLRKQYSARCFSPNPIPRSSAPCPAHSLDNMNKFPSTPSEYAAYKAVLNVTSTTISNTTPSSTPPMHIPFRSIPPQTLTNIIPTLSLNLGLGRALSSSLSPRSSTSLQPHQHSFSSNQTVRRRRVSKSVMAEAQWWIKMYESLTWHIKQVEEQQQQPPFSDHELAFLERLEAQVRSRWYPIVDKARMLTRRDNNYGCRIISSEGLHTSSGLCEKLRLPCQELSSSDSAEPTTVMLGPAQLAAQAFLRRSEASGKPMRRKRHILPGCSALRCEITA